MRIRVDATDAIGRSSRRGARRSGSKPPCDGRTGLGIRGKRDLTARGGEDTSATGLQGRDSASAEASQDEVILCEPAQIHPVAGVHADPPSGYLAEQPEVALVREDLLVGAVDTAEGSLPAHVRLWIQARCNATAARTSAP